LWPGSGQCGRINPTIMAIQGAPVGGKPSQTRWLNRNVAGMGLTSLLSDVGHEMVTAILPGFLATLGVSAAALGFIEGVADAVSSFVKLWAGWFSDRLRRRKPIAVGGYFLTGASCGLFALAFGWPLVLAARAIGWFGRGIRGPARNAILAASVPPEALGRAFGFERAGDTIGAVIGPLLAVGLLARLEPHAPTPSAPFRIVFLLALIPGLGSGLAFATLVKEGEQRASVAKFWASFKNLPRPFSRLLWGVGLFGMGDFAHTLMILAATQLLTPAYGLLRAAQIAGLFYVVHNLFYAATSYPVGALSDRWGRRGLLFAGYVLGSLTAVGLFAAFYWRIAALPFLGLLFVVGGIYVAFEEALESSLTADLVGPETRGTAYGVMGSVNGVGDFFASTAVGVVWTLASAAAAFAAAAILMLAGAIVLRSYQ
jgi:MFS family permease